MQRGIQIGRVELLDDEMIHAVNLNSGTEFKRKPTLFFEFSGSESQVKEQTQMVKKISESHGGSEFEWALDEKDKARLWQARKIALWASLTLRPDAQGPSN
eukprot:TRINITY_DN33860_c0_g1_i1.p1 TRINITY_DN33860_c0_g1~~TRINITY_DN33860_c0_g1_i1.p1  ORF type:complete len:101 (+),score=35.33 TRINITY_DN33860_c0_g1_i1:108-410(+)